VHIPGAHSRVVQVKALHGRMKQSVRESTLESYTKLPAGAALLLLLHHRCTIPCCLKCKPCQAIDENSIGHWRLTSL